MKRVGNGTQKRSDTACVIADVEVRRRDDRRSFASCLEQVNKNADEVSGFLSFSRYKDLVFKQAHQHGRVRPRLHKFG